MRPLAATWTTAFCLAALSARVGANAGEPTYAETLTVSECIAYAENVMVHDDGSITLDLDRSRPRLLTDNLGHPASYPTGASCHFLMPDGSGWQDENGTARTILTDGRISEHVALKAPDTATIEFDLKGIYYVDRVELFPYFYEHAGYIESVSVSASRDGKQWDDLGIAETAWPVLTHGTLPITHDAVDRFVRFVRITPNMAEKNRRGTISLIEVRIWGFPHFRTEGYVVTKPVDTRDGDLVTRWPEFQQEAFCGPSPETGEAVSPQPLDEPEVTPLPAPKNLSAEAANPEWPPGKLPPDTEIRYTVSAARRGDEGPPADAVTVKTPGGRNGHVKLTWDHVTGAGSYYIYRARHDGSLIRLGEKKILWTTPLEDIEWNSYIDWGPIGFGRTHYEWGILRKPGNKEDRAVPPPKVYRAEIVPGVGRAGGIGSVSYRVSWWNARGESAACDPITYMPPVGDHSMLLRWRAVSAAEGYKIYRKGFLSWELVARLSASEYKWLDTGVRGGSTVVARPCSPSNRFTRAYAPWFFDREHIATPESERLATQLRFDFHTADDQRTPVLRDVTLTRAVPPGRSYHIGDRTFPEGQLSPHNINNSLAKSDKWIAFDVEEKCQLLDGYRFQESSMAPTAVQPGRIVYTVEQPGTWHLGIVYRDDMDGREVWHVGINGKRLVTIHGNRWIWEWDHIEHKHKDQNDYLWLSTGAIDFRKGDRIEIENDGPPIACYRIDKLMFVPPGVDVLKEIGLERK